MDQSGQVAALDSDANKFEAPLPPADAKRERRLVLKVDLLLIPILTICYGLQFYDKAVLGSASVFGIIRDLGLSTTNNGVTSTLRYSTANSSFYFGYIASVLPMALILQRVPRLAKTLAALIFLWGLTAILTVVVSSYKGLIVQRVFLGMMESSVSPGFVILTNRWYKKSEIAVRLGLWYSATGIFSMFSGVLNFGLGHANGPLPTWKYLYIFAGSVTMAWAIVVALVLPDSIDSATRYFSEDERARLKQRVADDQQGASDRRFHLDQFVEALLDIKIWLFLAMGAAIYVCNGGVTAFGARIISTFGYTSLDAILLQIPGGAATCISIYIVTFIVGRWRNITTYVLAISCLFPLAGAIIVWKSSWTHRGWPVFGYTLLPIFGAPYVLLLTLSAQNVGGGTKKAVSAGAIFLGYNVGNIVAPYTVLTPEAKEHYRSTWIAIIVCMSFTIVASLALRCYLIYENRRKDRKEADAIAALAESTRSSMEKDDTKSDARLDLRLLARDMTDKRNPFMRYSL